MMPSGLQHRNRGCHNGARCTFAHSHSLLASLSESRLGPFHVPAPRPADCRALRRHMRRCDRADRDGRLRGPVAHDARCRTCPPSRWRAHGSGRRVGTVRCRLRVVGGAGRLWRGDWLAWRAVRRRRASAASMAGRRSLVAPHQRLCRRRRRRVGAGRRRPDAASRSGTAARPGALLGRREPVARPIPERRHPQFASRPAVGVGWRVPPVRCIAFDRCSVGGRQTHWTWFRSAGRHGGAVPLPRHGSPAHRTGRCPRRARRRFVALGPGGGRRGTG